MYKMHKYHKSMSRYLLKQGVAVACCLALVGCSDTPDQTAKEAPQASPVPDPVPNQTVAEGTTEQAPPPTVASPKQRTVSDEQFFQAAGAGEIATIGQAIQQGINVDTPDPDGQTALMFAGFNGHTKVMRLLLEHGADVNHTSVLDRTALMVTASGPNLEAVELLLSEGAKVNMRDSHEGWTALMIAATEGQTEIVKRLLASGADKTLAEKDGETALIFAKNQGHQEIVQLLQDDQKAEEK